MPNPPTIGVIGGSGVYAMEGLTEVESVRVKTPFGDPSDEIVIGTLAGRPATGGGTASAPA